MKYKLLNTSGMNILCLEDGTRIPAQISATTQIVREKCRVRVNAFCDERLGTADDTKLKIVDGVLTYGKYILDDISELHYDEGKKDPEFIMGTVSFTVDCDLPDTIEQPIIYGDGSECFNLKIDRHNGSGPIPLLHLNDSDTIIIGENTISASFFDFLKKEAQEKRLIRLSLSDDGEIMFTTIFENKNTG